MPFNPVLFVCISFNAILQNSASYCICKDRNNQLILKMQKKITGKSENSCYEV